MPTRARSFGRSVPLSPTETPSTQVSPFVNGSRPLTHWMSVDLPDPDGPHTTTTWPLATRVVQPRRTWKSPNHLLTSSTSIMGNSSDDSGARLQPPHQRRQRE